MKHEEKNILNEIILIKSRIDDLDNFKDFINKNRENLVSRGILTIEKLNKSSNKITSLRDKYINEMIDTIDQLE